MKLSEMDLRYGIVKNSFFVVRSLMLLVSVSVSLKRVRVSFFECNVM